MRDDDQRAERGERELRAPAARRAHQNREREQRKTQRELEVHEAPEEGLVVHEREREQHQPLGLAERAQQGPEAHRQRGQREHDDDAHAQLERGERREGHRHQVREQVERAIPGGLVEGGEAETRVIEVPEDGYRRQVLRQVGHRQVGERRSGREQQHEEQRGEQPRSRFGRRGFARAGRLLQSRLPPRFLPQHAASG
jgi:hypothetical protein